MYRGDVPFTFFGSTILIIGACFTYFTTGFSEPSWEIPAKSQEDTSNGSKGFFSDTLLYLLCGMHFLYVSIGVAGNVWLATYFEKYLNVTSESAALRLTVFWVGVLLGRLTILFLKPRWTLWPAILAASIGMMIANIFLSVPWGPTTATVIVFAAGFFAGPMWPIIVSISQKSRGSALFTSSVIGAGAIGAACGPFLSSFSIDLVGMRFLFPTLACFGALLVVLILVAREYSERNCC